MAIPRSMQQQLIEHIVANSDAGAFLPLVVYRWLGDDGAGAGPVPGHVATVGGWALPGSEPSQGLGLTVRRMTV